MANKAGTGTVQGEHAVTSEALNKAERTLLLKALADPRRYEVLERIAASACAMGCTQLLKDVPIAAATMSHHLKELEMAGLIDVRREGKYAFLTPRKGVLHRLAATIDALDVEHCEGT